MSVPAYPSYRDSGVEWLGEVPSHWEVRRVKDLAEIVNGFPFDSKLFDSNVGRPLLRIRDLNADECDVRFNGAADPRFEVTNLDLLVGMDGDFNVGRWRGGEPALLNQRVCALRTDDEVCSRFLEHALSEPLKRINDLTYSTTVKHLSSFQIASIRVAIPPERAGLAGLVLFLDRETAKIDALVEEQRRLVELLKEKRQAVISHAVTKGLDPTVPMKDSGVEWLGEVPAHWEVKRLKFVAHIQTGIAKGKDIAGREVLSVPYLRVANVQDGWIDLSEVAMIDLPVDEIDRYLLRVGDVLMNEGGDFDKLGRGGVWDGSVAPCVHQNHVFAVRPFDVSPEWLNFTTTSNAAQFFFMGRSKQSTNLASISSTNLMELPLLAPPRAEQDALVQRLSEGCRQLDDLMSEAQSAIALLQERRSALISAAVTGKIDVRGLVPSKAEAA